jgi:hypothetical protein
MRHLALEPTTAVRTVQGIFGQLSLADHTLVVVVRREPWRSTTPWLFDGLLRAARTQGLDHLAVVFDTDDGTHLLRQSALRRSTTPDQHALRALAATHQVALDAARFNRRRLLVGGYPSALPVYDHAVLDLTTSVSSGAPVVTNRLVMLQATLPVFVPPGPDVPRDHLAPRFATLLADWIANTPWGRLYRRYQYALVGAGRNRSR